MKKIIFYLMTICLLLTIQPLKINAANSVAKPSSVMSKISDSTEVSCLLIRLDEINKMDKSSLKSSEKKILRNEVRSIKSQLEAKDAKAVNSGGGGGVYISAGALIIIILLLIILL